MKDNNSIENQILERIRSQINPNLKIRKHLTALKFFWFISCLLCVVFVCFLHFYPEFRKEFEESYIILIYFPALFMIILIILGLRLQEIELIEYRNQSKFKHD